MKPVTTNQFRIGPAKLTHPSRVGRPRPQLDPPAGIRILEKENRDVLATATHELRAPLGNILIMAELLREQAGGTLNDVQRNVIAQICDNARFMSRMINRYLANTCPGDGTPSPTKGMLEELIAKIVSNHRYNADPRSIQLSCQVSGEIPELIIDEDLIREALDNVLKNAIEHSPDDAAVVVRLSAYGSRAIIEVMDEGPGIPVKKLDQLFFPSSRGYHYEGDGRLSCGIGLSISRNIIEAHNGEIHAMNRPSGGLAVRIFLPLLTEAGA